MALRVKSDFKKGAKQWNCFVSGISGHYFKAFRRKETAQGSKCGDRGQIEEANKRKWDGGKHHLVEMSPRLATSDEEYCSFYLLEASRQASGQCLHRLHIDKHPNIDAFLDFLPIQTVLRNENGESCRLAERGSVWISIPSSKREFQCNFKDAFWAADYSSYFLSASWCIDWGHGLTFDK